MSSTAPPSILASPILELVGLAGIQLGRKMSAANNKHPSPRVFCKSGKQRTYA